MDTVILIYLVINSCERERGYNVNTIDIIAIETFKILTNMMMASLHYECRLHK